MMSKVSHECFRFTVSQTSYHFSAKLFNPAHVNEFFGAVHEVRFKQIHRQHSIYDRQTCSEFFFNKKRDAVVKGLRGATNILMGQVIPAA